MPKAKNTIPNTSSDAERKERTEHNEAILKNLHDPLVRNVLKYLDTEDLVRTAGTCTTLYNWVTPEKNKIFQEQILQAVAYGNQESAERMLKHNPQYLLWDTAEAKDHSGRNIQKLTPFQAALCAGDVEMVEMMKPYFVQAFGENADTEMQRQFNQVFPNGIEAHAQKQQEEAFDFGAILAAILSASLEEVNLELSNPGQDNNSPLCQALNDFRKAFKDKSHSEIIFNPQHFLNALETYNDNFNAFPNWDKRDLFWRQVMGFTQRYFPACYAQACAQGTYYIVKNNQPLKRSFDFGYGDGSIFPLVDNSGLGYNWTVGHPGGPLAGRRARWSGATLRESFSNLMSDKNTMLTTGFQPTTRQSVKPRTTLGA